MSGDEIKFWDSSDTPSYGDWLRSAESVVGAENVESILHTTLPNGIRTKPIYTGEMVGDISDLPSVGLNLRSSNPAGNVNGWDIRQRHWVTDTEKTNKAILNDLSRGTRSIELVLENSEFGSYEELLSGVLLNIAGIGLSSSCGSVSNASHLFDYMKTGLPNSEENICDLGVDPVGELLIESSDFSRFESDSQIALELSSKVSAEFSNMTTFRIDGLKFAQVGADPITEIAGILSALVSYLRLMDEAGVKTDVALSQCLIVVSVGTDQFFDIAKLRALRLLIANIGRECGVQDTQLRTQAQTPDFLISQDDPWVNLLRTTVSCFAAATGGSDIITLPTFDSAFGLPDEFGQRLARNTHLVLMEESNIHRVIDPAGGSWYVETITKEITDNAWQKFQEIEANGGFIEQVASGQFKEQAKQSRQDFKKKVLSNEMTFIGVNAFRETEGTDLARDPYPIHSNDRYTKELDFRISDIKGDYEEKNADS